MSKFSSDSEIVNKESNLNSRLKRTSQRKLLSQNLNRTNDYDSDNDQYDQEGYPLEEEEYCRKDEEEYSNQLKHRLNELLTSEQKSAKRYKRTKDQKVSASTKSTNSSYTRTSGSTSTSSANYQDNSNKCIQVNCNSIIGELHTNKFGSGGKGSCIKVLVQKTESESGATEMVEKWMTPIEFENYCGKSNCRDWKRTIKVGGQCIATLLEDNTLICHAVSCSCAVCNKNDTLLGPFRPFLRYRRRNKDQILAQNAFKKFLSLKPPTLLQDSIHKIKEQGTDSGDGSGVGGGSSPEETSGVYLSGKHMQVLGTVSGKQGSGGGGCDKDLVASLREFEESEEKKWTLIQQKSNHLMEQCQTLQALIGQSRKESELNRQILIRKFFDNI